MEIEQDKIVVLESQMVVLESKTKAGKMFAC